MRKLTLNQTWDRCLRMWRYVIRNLGDTPICVSKRIWIKEHYPKDNPHMDCYFCEYAQPERYKGGKKHCPNCPGVLIDPKFFCENKTYSWNNNPEAFLAKLESLNAKRLASKKVK